MPLPIRLCLYIIDILNKVQGQKPYELGNKEHRHNMCHEPNNIIQDLCFDEVDFPRKLRVGAIILRITRFAIIKIIGFDLLLLRWEI